MQDMYQFSNSGEEFVALQCLWCHEKMWNPLILPCLHTFCENCIIQWLEEYIEQFGDLPKKMRCPTCSSPVRIPENGLEGLRYDAQISHVRGLMERLSMKEGYSRHEASQDYQRDATAMIPPPATTVDMSDVNKLSTVQMVGSCDRCTAPLIYTTNNKQTNATVMSRGNALHPSTPHYGSMQGVMDFDGEMWAPGVTG